MRSASQWRKWCYELGWATIGQGTVQAMLADLMTLERQLEEADCVSIEKDEQRYDLERQVAELEESEHRWRQEYKDAEQQIHALCDRVEELTKRLADVEGDNEILQQWDD